MVRPLIFSLAVAGLSLAGLSLTGCASGGTAHKGHDGAMMDGAAATACPLCKKGMAGETVWCDHCKAGFVGGEKVTCAGCYAQTTTGVPCPTCSAK